SDRLRGRRRRAAGGRVSRRSRRQPEAGARDGHDHHKGDRPRRRHRRAGDAARPGAPLTPRIALPSEELSDYTSGILSRRPMSAPPASLDDLRREIDAIDDALFAALVRRAALMANVAEAKRAQNAASPMRPGREAIVLRR